LKEMIYRYLFEENKLNSNTIKITLGFARDAMCIPIKVTRGKMAVGGRCLFACNFYMRAQLATPTAQKEEECLCEDNQCGRIACYPAPSCLY
jgi:hypothetical protein